MVRIRPAHILRLMEGRGCPDRVELWESVLKELFDKINNGELVGQNSILQWVKAAKKRKWGENAISWLKGDEVLLQELRMKNRTGELKTTRSIVQWVKTQQNLKEFAKFDEMGGVKFSVKTEKNIVQWRCGSANFDGCFCSDPGLAVSARKKTACVEKVAKTAKTFNC